MLNRSLIYNFVISLLLLVFFGCAVNPVTGRQELMFVSEEREVSMGREAAPSLNWGFGGEYKDKELENYLGGIINRIWSVSERPNIPYSFHIQNTSLPNAFALPGYVAITRGLLAELDNEAQFAAIMGHETGHVMARHSAQRISRSILAQTGLGLGGALLGDSKGSEALMVLGSLSTSLILLKYDRSQELEADRLGVAYASKIGYDPREGITAHEKLEIIANNYLKREGRESSSGGFFNSILSTHPRKEVRVDEINRMIKDLPPYKLTGDGKFSSGFQSRISDIKKVHAAYLVYDEAERAYEKKNYSDAEKLVGKAIEMNSRQAPFYTLLGKVSLAKERIDDAVREFKTSLSIDSGYQPAVYALGVCEYKKGSYQAALDFFKKSLSLYPDHPGSLYSSGLCYHFLNRPEEALKAFGAFAPMVDKHPEVYGYMGMNFEKTSRVNDAIESYKAQLKIDPENKMGQYAKQRLSVLGRGPVR
jgi:beta-barrel assembly-enhancing protease